MGYKKITVDPILEGGGGRLLRPPGSATDTHVIQTK